MEKNTYNKYIIAFIYKKKKTDLFCFLLFDPKFAKLSECRTIIIIQETFGGKINLFQTVRR
jgi:hypothetical protein